MIEIELGVPDLIDAFYKYLDNAPALFKDGLTRVETEVQAFAIKTMPDATPDNPRPKYPNAPYPLRWKSQKQRRAFFATNGFDGGIPYKRTGAMMQLWFVETEGSLTSGEMDIVNASASATYIIGEDQQPYHEDIGWPNLYEEPEKNKQVQQVSAFASQQVTDLHNEILEAW